MRVGGMGVMIARAMGAAVGGLITASLRTKARAITTGILLVIAMCVGMHVCSANNTATARVEKQIHQQDLREVAKYDHMPAPKLPPQCTTAVKSGTHTVRVDSKGRVSTSTTSAQTTKTCK